MGQREFISSEGVKVRLVKFSGCHVYLMNVLTWTTFKIAFHDFEQLFTEVAK